MKTKTTLVIAALAVILGVAFAAWQEQATISVNAQTGYIDLDIVPDEYPWKFLGRFPRVRADYTLAGSDPGNDGPPVLTLTLSNLYPGINYIVFSAKIKNDGTLPVKITNCNFKFVGGSFTFGDVDFSWLDIEIDVDAHKRGVGPPRDIVLDPGEEAVLTIAIRVKSGAPEEASVTAQFTCDYKQAVP